MNSPLFKGQTSYVSNFWHFVKQALNSSTHLVNAVQLCMPHVSFFVSH